MFEVSRIINAARLARPFARKCQSLYYILYYPFFANGISVVFSSLSGVLSIGTHHHVLLGEFLEGSVAHWRLQIVQSDFYAIDHPVEFA
jgi:hypothetical protein